MSNSILKISEAASLAMHACAVLAAHKGEPMAVGTIASALEASEAHLSKVFQELARGGLVRSLRGPKGGFSLTRPAEEITLLDVFEAIEGPFQAASCIRHASAGILPRRELHSRRTGKFGEPTDAGLSVQYPVIVFGRDFCGSVIGYP